MTNELFTKVKIHLLEDEKPSIFFNNIKNEFVNTDLKKLYDLQEVEQEKEHHPEGNVWNHVMLVVDNAAKLRKYANDKEAFMFGALFHDIGKKTTTVRNKKGRLISYNHDTVGAKELSEILHNFDLKEEEENNIINFVKYHMHHLYLIKELPFGDINSMLKEMDINDLILLFASDRLGRGQNTKEKIEKEIEDLNKIIKILEEKSGKDMKDIKEKVKNFEKELL